MLAKQEFLLRLIAQLIPSIILIDQLQFHKTSTTTFAHNRNKSLLLEEKKSLPSSYYTICLWSS